MANFTKNPDELPDDSLQSHEAETGLAWAMLFAPQVFQTFGHQILPEMFVHREYQLICLGYRELLNKGMKPDAVSVADWLRSAGLLLEVGGEDSLVRLENEVPHSGHTEAYVKRLIDCWKRRLGHQKLRLMAEALSTPGSDIEGLLGDLGVTDASAETGWPLIRSFDEMELPNFPTHVLPEVLRAWVESLSVATQTPPDLAGLLTLAVCSVPISKRVEVEPRQNWREPLNLFVCPILPPGNRKSQVFSDCIRPVREKEAELIETAKPFVAREKSERRQKEARLKSLEKKAAETGDAEVRHEAGGLAEELEQKPEPVLPKLILDDATSEKVGMTLAEQSGRIASMSPEGGVFDLMAGFYSKNGSTSFDVYLKGHAGDDLVTDRVSRESVRVKRPALTCAYAVQPVVLKGLAANPAFRGRGLMARFLYGYPRSWIGDRKIAPPAVPEPVRDRFYRVVRDLFETETGSVLRLGSQASESMIEWEAEIESMLADGGIMEEIRDWGSKLAGATLRLAGILHCVEHGAVGKISRSTLVSAIEIARYLIPHADAVHSMMAAKESPRDGDAKYVLNWILRNRREEFTKREVHQHGRRRFSKPEDVVPALEELTKRGYIRLQPVESSGPGRHPSPAFRVNPAVFQTDEKRTQNPQNWPITRSESNSVNCEYSSAQEECEDCDEIELPVDPFVEDLPVTPSGEPARGKDF